MHTHYSLRLAFLMVLLMALEFAACAKTTATSVSPQNSDAVNRVQVFYSPPTDREYTELGLVTTQTGQTIVHDRSAAGMIAKLRAEASRMGGDAIIVRSVNEGTWGLQGGGNTGFDRGNAQAVVIKFK